MRTNSQLLVAAATASIVLITVGAFAQDGQQPTVTDTHMSGNWTVRCYHAQTSLCEMVEVMIARAGPNNANVRVASVAISYVPKSDSYFGRFGVPLGVSFDQGLGLAVGSFNQANLKYRVCERDGCYVTGMLPQALIDAMKDTSNPKGAMDVQMVDGRKIQIPIVLNGFSDGLDVLKKLTLAKDAEAQKATKR